jgi:hypothetical protein
MQIKTSPKSSSKPAKAVGGAFGLMVMATVSALAFTQLGRDVAHLSQTEVVSVPAFSVAFDGPAATVQATKAQERHGNLAAQSVALEMDGVLILNDWQYLAVPGRVVSAAR